MKKHILLTAIFLALITVVPASAFMNGTGMSGDNDSTGMMGAGGSFGMTNGMSGSPVVGADGTAYVVSYQGSSSGNTANMVSTINAISASGDRTSITLTGLSSKPVLSSDGKYLIATTSLPSMSNFNMMNSATIDSGSSSVVYAITLPLTNTTAPVAVSLEGSFASYPVMANDKIYVTTTNMGSAMYGSGMFSDDSNQTTKSYLYTIGMDGTIISRVEL